MDVLDPNDVMQHMRLCQHIAGLRIQVATGMTYSRGSLIKSAAKSYDTTSRTAKGTLAELEALYEKTYDKKYGVPRC